MEIEQPMTENQTELSFSNEIKTYLNTASKWATFMAVMGFIGTVLIVLAGISMTIFGTVLPNLMPHYNTVLPNMFFPMMGLLYILMAALYFFPSLYMYRFASKAKKALVNNTQEELNESFRNLKKWFKFIGIMIIIGICSYIVMIPVFAILSVTNAF